MANAIQFTPPAHLPAPDFGDYFTDGKFDYDKMVEGDNAYREILREWCRSTGSGEFAGEILRFPAGDGAAEYMVRSLRPKQFIHIPLGDAWTVPDYTLRGLRADDIRRMVDGERRMRELFGGKR